MSNKKFKIEKFHKKELVPIAFLENTDNAKANLEAYLSGQMRSMKFSPGQEVAHVHDYDQRMFVRRPIYKDVKKNDKIESHFDGVECHWWEEK